MPAARAPFVPTPMSARAAMPHIVMIPEDPEGGSVAGACFEVRLPYHVGNGCEKMSDLKPRCPTRAGTRSVTSRPRVPATKPRLLT